MVQFFWPHSVRIVLHLSVFIFHDCTLKRGEYVILIQTQLLQLLTRRNCVCVVYGVFT